MATLRPLTPGVGSRFSATSISRSLGFANGTRSALFLVFGGAMLAFCLERFVWYLNNAFCARDSDFPGECYWYSRGLEGLAYRLHVLTVIPGSILACLQFIPALQRNKLVSFHRVNGYVVLVLSAVATVTAWIIGPVAVGGTLLVQIGLFISSGSFVFALLKAYISIRQLRIDEHREWMLRAWSYAGMVVTMRPMLILMAIAISGPDSPYYQPMACKVIDYILYGSHEGMSKGPHHNMLEVAPGCAAYVTGDDPAQFTAIQANMNDVTLVGTAAALEIGFTASGYLSFLIHAAAAEVYIRKTWAETERLKVVSKHRQLLRAQGRSDSCASELSTPKQELDTPKATSGGQEKKALPDPYTDRNL